MKKSSIARLCLVAGLLLPLTGTSQSTDGYHAIQIFPVVVDTASFAQRFNITNPNASALVLTPRYFPGQGTAQAGNPLVCPDIAVPANSAVTISSLRAMCPAMVAGSAFGFLHLSESSSLHLSFAAFSRVSNPQGNGFSVEAFPANTFTSAQTVVNGIRRLAATPSAPSFQTNCFVAVVNELAPPGAASPQTIDYTVYNSDGLLIGQNSVQLTPGNFVRLLDVFLAAGAAAGDYNDASARFSTSAGTSLLSFCTVQDNTSFGADFRVGKQAQLPAALGAGIGVQDDVAARNSTAFTDMYLPADGMEKPYVLTSGTTRNVHVAYFRHPDWISCELINPSTNVRATAGYGLELRLFDASGSQMAGGPGVTGFSGLYLGDKRARNNTASTRYSLEVRGDGSLFTDHAYGLHCRSGSGHTLGDQVRANLALGVAAEAEPNDSTSQASSTTLRFSYYADIAGAISPGTDIDMVRGEIAAAPTVFRFETFGPDFRDCSGTTTTLRLRDFAGTPILSDISSGITTCSAIVFPFETSGTYYISVEEAGNNASIPGYYLESRQIPAVGGEAEPNDNPATANANFGTATQGFVSGDHVLDTDFDYYSIFVPAGSGVRAEVIEGSRATETCESNGIDSLLTLYAADGVTQLVQDDDSGRGFCSMIDGTGQNSLHALAKNSTGSAQTWYLRVAKSGAAGVGNASTFSYRLVVTVR
ncbi:MAG: hypothetical protein NT117_05345 [Gammaproteobacteria bacterium]|nr:hypothetical protein [Gammaproteobacteria bacterium]